MGLWKFRRLSTAEKLAKDREKLKQKELREVVPKLARFSDSETAEGYRYIEHELCKLNPQNKAEVIYRLENEHGFIIMRKDGHFHYAVISEAIAAGREAAGWTRVTASKTGLPVPCQGE